MSSQNNRYQADVAIVGGGISGIVTALELLDFGKRVLLLDRGPEGYFGGQAITAFGGMTIVGSPLQKLFGVKDITLNEDEDEKIEEKWQEVKRDMYRDILEKIESEQKKDQYKTSIIEKIPVLDREIKNAFKYFYDVELNKKEKIHQAPFASVRIRTRNDRSSGM